MAKIQLNGRIIKIRAKSSIFDLLKKYKLNNKKVAIEYNGVIISKENIKENILKIRIN